MKYGMMFAVAGMFLIMTACGNLDKYQGQTEDPNPAAEEMEFVDRPPSGVDNPRMINDVGETWGLAEDREKIKQAAESVPGVDVQRIILEASKVRVTADVDRENLSEADKKDWEEQILNAVEQAMPRYDITVKVR
jgi:hypothetical protein